MPAEDNIERVNINEITAQQFIDKYEKGSRPCIITGVADSWPALEAWRVNKLIEKFGSSMFKCGETDGGRKLKVTLKEYIEYALYNRDDSPLYMFEACLEEHPEAKVMMNDYRPPTILSEDLFTELVSLKPTLTFSLAKVVHRPIVGS